MASRKKVVIVGGGVAGANLAKALEKKNIFDVTLVDTKDYVEVLCTAWYWGQPVHIYSLDLPCAFVNEQ